MNNPSNNPNDVSRKAVKYGIILNLIYFFFIGGMSGGLYWLCTGHIEHSLWCGLASYAFLANCLNFAAGYESFEMIGKLEPEPTASDVTR